jgi:hypothetical protein
MAIDRDALALEFFRSLVEKNGGDNAEGLAAQAARMADALADEMAKTPRERAIEDDARMRIKKAQSEAFSASWKLDGALEKLADAKAQLAEANARLEPELVRTKVTFSVG